MSARKARLCFRGFLLPRACALCRLRRAVWFVAASAAAAAAFARVLRPGGLLVYAVPAPRHLLGLKRVLYETPYENPVQEVAYEGFRPIGEREVSGSITVPAGQLEALFAMTPYYWKTPRDGAARLAALPELTTDISFRFLVFEKK